MAKLSCSELSLQNFRILSALDGFQAMEILEQETPDLMILDLMMPRMSGFEVCQKIRESYDSSELPIIIVTAKNQISDLIQGLHLRSLLSLIRCVMILPVNIPPEYITFLH